jgi:hypothetical protein
MHYEIEIREHDHGRGPDGEPPTGGQRWAAFKAFGADGIARPLTFGSREEPRDYAYRNPCLARIVEVADDGGRVPAGTTLP